MITFKEDYTVQFTTETNWHSGCFTFLKGRSYECIWLNRGVKIWNADKSIGIVLKGRDILKYLEEKR